MLTHESLVEELPTPVPNAVKDALAQGLKVLGDVSVSENSRD